MRGNLVPLPSGEKKARAVRSMFDRIAPRYDLVNRVMTFGMDVGWRKRSVEELGLPRRSLVLDLACGTGDLSSLLSGKWYKSVGIDFSFEMLRHSHAQAPMVQGDILSLPVRTGSVDGVVCGFALRNVVDLQGLFDEIARVVRPGGRIALLEVAEPRRGMMRRGHALYFKRVVPLIGGLLSDKAAYSYLPRSVAYLPQPVELLNMLRAAGFADADRIELTGGIAQLLTGTREGVAA